MVQVRDKLEPEGDFGGTVVVSDPGLQANVQVQLLFGGIFGPGDFLESVWLCVDELGVLRNWLIWVTGKIKKNSIEMCWLLLCWLFLACFMSDT